MKCYQCRKKLAEECETCPKCGAVQIFSKELIDAAINQDQDAITQLYQMTKDNVYFTIFSMEKKEDVVQDLLQDTYVKAFRSLSQLKEPAAFRSWIKRIAHNHTIDYLRKKKPALFTDMVSAESNEVLDFRDDRPDSYPETVIDQKETASLLKDILNSLSDEQRVAVSLHYYQQFSIKEIAEQLSVTENTIKSRLNYARRHIEKKVRELERQGTKLYGMLPFPFFLWLLDLGEDPGMFAIPDKEVLSNILSSTMDTFSRGTVSKAVDTAGKAAGKTAATGTASAGKGVIMAKIVGVVATVTVVVIGGMMIAKGSPQDDPVPTIEQMTTEAPEDNTEATKEPVTEKEAYEKVLQLYRDLCNMNDVEYHKLYNHEEQINDLDPEDQTINSVFMDYYHSTQIEDAADPADNFMSCHYGTYYYSFYDIDKNGTDELLIGNSGNEYADAEKTILEIYTFDGQNATRLVGFDSSIAYYEEPDTDPSTWNQILIADDGSMFVADQGFGDPVYPARILQLSDNGYDFEIIEESEELIEESYDNNLNEISDFLDEHGKPAIEWNKLDGLNTPEKDIDQFYGIYETHSDEDNSHGNALVLDLSGGGILYNDLSFGRPIISIHDPEDPAEDAIDTEYHEFSTYSTIPVIEGNTLTLIIEDVLPDENIDSSEIPNCSLKLIRNEDGSITVTCTDIFVYSLDESMNRDMMRLFSLFDDVTFYPVSK